jgi:hypothetical protein
MKNSEKIVCISCNSQDVEVKIWVNANTLIVSDVNSIENEYNFGWCNTCERKRTLKKIVIHDKKTQV